ncbi:b29e2ace-4a16-44e5-a631-9fd105b82cda [Thermothielavioides terrestris]|uniref:B29e2ace-4a16-44e5-a631-9fd105b82cda n=1 Tax=Thermothielavioides terrestris TaxID=2587410 RepID=A0A3S4AUX2_9PEZI|nr:b29e2ace-4a16-44e5-a631-9fd105b82cda [Thermothielavioides terrestris]
MGKIIKAAI